MIAFLHTSEVHIKRFSELARKFNPETPILHYVNANLLNFALTNNKLDAEGFKKAIQDIEKSAKPQQIICTCSTYGEACNNYENVKRIDAPIVKLLVQQYTTIALAFTANSTALVSKRLLEQEAKNQNKKINIVDCNCTDAWPYFNDGSNRYEYKIAKHINTLDNTIDAVFLAQASMEEVTNYINNKKLKIYSSPEFGVKTYLTA